MWEEEKERPSLDISPEAMPHRVDESQQHKGRKEELPYIVEAADQTLEEIGSLADVLLEKYAHSAEDRAEAGEKEDERGRPVDDISPRMTQDRHGEEENDHPAYEIE